MPDEMTPSVLGLWPWGSARSREVVPRKTGGLLVYLARSGARIKLALVEVDSPSAPTAVVQSGRRPLLQ